MMLRLVDFLMFLLQAQAQTLQRLAALLGEEALIALLETAGERDEEEGTPTMVIPMDSWESPPVGTDPGNPYMELEDFVHEMKLPAQLEFYLWTYPHYRAYAESRLRLDSKIDGRSGRAATVMIEEAVAQAETWVRRLPVPPSLGAQVESAARVPWLRFRTEMLQKLGRRPLGAVQK